MSMGMRVLPYRVLKQDEVQALGDGWNVVTADGRAQVLRDGEALAGWDGLMAFELSRDFLFVRDPGEALGLMSRQSCCELVVSLSTGRGLRRSIAYREAVTPGHGGRMRVSIAPDSTHLATELSVTAAVVVTVPGRAKDQLAPSAAGHRVWEESTRIRLEGGAARLPMYEVAFEEAFPGDHVEHAEFRVTILDEPELDLEYAVLVYLNSTNPVFISEVTVPGSGAERRLWGGVVRQTIAAAILRDAAAVSQVGSEASLGAAVRRWAGQIWPSLSLSAVRELVTADLPRFEAQVESWVGSVLHPAGKAGAP